MYSPVTPVPRACTGCFTRDYRNTDKSHRFEQETQIGTKAITGEDADVKVDEIEGTQEAQIQG